MATGECRGRLGGGNSGKISPEPVLKVQTCFRQMTIPMTSWMREQVTGYDDMTPGFDAWFHTQVIFNIGQFNTA